MRDIHQGFQGTAGAAEAAALFQFLDAADALESVAAYRRQMLELCPPREGQRILDVGCGLGHSAARLASQVGDGGFVLGVDKNELFVAEARRRSAGLSLPLGFEVGVATRLDLPAASFDVCRTERVLMYLEDPALAIDSMLRVLRPGGQLISFEFDYEGMIVDAPSPELTRRIGRRVADSVPSPWIGRQLPRLLKERGMRDVTVRPQILSAPYPMFQRVVQGALAQPLATGELAAAEVEAWWQALQRAADSGHWLAGFSGFVVHGVAP
jgi:ubiquinone/menaquinone biosynthesis C-methylase UbiE